ncbi:hypothetical protein ACIP5T_18650 [Microbacterium sp. NPDC088619]|uniref:hypothetical protein n=1 Tax=Microbacterium sp. NPDC088619 TaxID=3364196 RepID=UPI0038203AD0
MSVSDVEIDRLFRAMSPASDLADRPSLSAAEIAIREGIIRGTFRRAPRRSRRGIVWAGVTTATAAMAVAVLVAVTVLTPSQPAMALTPPPLSYTAAPALAEVFADAQDALQAPPDVEQESRVRSVAWGWNVDMGDKRVEIVPQEITFTWAPGETATSTIIAGDSLWPDGNRPEGVEPSPYEPGEVIDTVVTPPEEFTLPPAAQELRGSSREDLESALAVFGATPESSSGELAAAIMGLFGYWTLNDEQHATLLEILADADGISVRGETNDRLGRDVIGLQMSSVIPERVETLFVSVETGRIVGVESELVKSLDGLPTGVILYTMWDADEADSR